MTYITNTLGNLIHQTAFFGLSWGNYLMILVAFVFLYLAIAKGFEPLLLVPIAFGMLLVNIYPDIMAKPANGSPGGLLYYFFTLDEWAILPSLIFMGVGAMTDFGPLIANPMSFLLGAAAQFGDYTVNDGHRKGITTPVTSLLKFSFVERIRAASILDEFGDNGTVFLPEVGILIFPHCFYNLLMYFFW